MATAQQAHLTAEEFLEWAARPENRAKRWELERGEPQEMPPPGEIHGLVAAWLAHLLWSYIIQQRRGRGRVIANDTGLVVERGPDTVRAPDVMLFAESLRAESASRGYPATLPLLIVEVKSPSDTFARMLRRATQYLEAGVPLVWLIDPEGQTTSVIQANEFPRLLEGNDGLGNDRHLPDLPLRVVDLFSFPQPVPE